MGFSFNQGLDQFGRAAGTRRGAPSCGEAWERSRRLAPSQRGAGGGGATYWWTALQRFRLRVLRGFASSLPRLRQGVVAEAIAQDGVVVGADGAVIGVAGAWRTIARVESAAGAQAGSGGSANRRLRPHFLGRDCGAAMKNTFQKDGTQV